MKEEFEVISSDPSHRYQLWLRLQDTHGWMCGGQHPTRQAAEKAKADVLAAWLDGADLNQARELKAGEWIINHRPEPK